MTYIFIQCCAVGSCDDLDWFCQVRTLRMRNMDKFSSVFKAWLIPKNIYLGSALVCAGLLVGAVIISFVVTLVPCPLCIAQRIFFGLVGLVAVAGYFGWLDRFSVRAAGSLMLIFSVSGGAIALRQMWIQYFPPADFDPTKCGVLFGSFIDTFLRALGGSGSCAIRDFTLIGLSLPEWSLLCFVGLAVVAGWLLMSGVRLAADKSV